MELATMSKEAVKEWCSLKNALSMLACSIQKN